MNQMKRLDGRTRNLLGDKCLLGSKCPASSRDGHVASTHGEAWEDGTQPLPSKQPVLLTDGNEMVRQFKTRSRLQLRADRGSVSPRVDLVFINS